MQLHKSLFLSAFFFLLLIGLPSFASANVINLVGFSSVGNNCGALDLEATVSNSPQGVEFGYKVEDGDWQQIGSDTDPNEGWKIRWDSGDIYSWEVRVRARTLPSGIWFTSAPFKLFNLTTNAITGIVSPATGVVDLATTYSGPDPNLFPVAFPEGAPNYIVYNSYLRYTADGLITPRPGTISKIRTNFGGSGTIGIKFAAWAPGPATTPYYTTVAFTVGTGIQSFPVAMANISEGSYIGFIISTYSSSTYVIYCSWSSATGSPMPSYDKIRYGRGTTGIWQTTTSYQGPAIEYTLENPYVDFQGVEFGYKYSSTGTPHIIGPGVDAGGGSYTCSWNTAVPGQEIGSDKVYVGTRATNKTTPCGWIWQGPYTVVNTVNVVLNNSVGSGEIIVDNLEHKVVYNTAWTFLDSHSISAPLYLNENDTSRQVFGRWIHGGTRTQTFKFNSSSTRSYFAQYLTQFRYDASTPYSTISGTESGWYNFNSNIRSSVESFVTGAEGERYTCVGWLGTGAIGNGNTNDTGIFLLTEATTVTFLWSKQYYLNVINPHGATLGSPSGWYADGETLSSYVESPMSISDLERWACIGWSGEGSIGDGEFSYSGEFVITENTTITWNWKRQYRLQIATNYGSILPSNDSWHFVGAVVDVEAFSPGNTSEQRFTWVGWTGSGLLGIPSGTQAMSVTMTLPKHFTATWTAEYYLMAIAQNGTLGNDYNGWYPAGTALSIAASPPAAEPGVRFVIGWEGNGFTEVDASFTAPNPIDIVMNQPVSIFSIWERQYSLQIINPQGIGVVVPQIGTYWYFIGEHVSGYSTFRTQGMISKGLVGTGSATTSTQPFFAFKMTEPSTVTWHWGAADVTSPVSWSDERNLAVNLGGTLVDSIRAKDGSPIVTYFSEIDSALKVARLKGAEWLVETIFAYSSKADLGVGAAPGNNISMDLDSNGVPHIAFYDPSSRSLMYAFLSGTEWSVSVIDDEFNPGLYCSIKIFKDNVPHFAYYRGETGDLVYAVLMDNLFTCTVVDSVDNVGLHASLALSPRDGSPRIAYYDATNGDLKCAIKNGDGFDIWIVDADGDVGMECVISVDPAGAPLIAYQENTGENAQGLRFAFFVDDAWQVYDLDFANLTGFGIDMGVDTAGNPHISYHDFNALKYAVFNGLVWVSSTLVSGDLTGETSISFDDAGNPAITYWKGRNLEYIDSKTNTYDGPVNVDEYLGQVEAALPSGGGGCFIATASFGSLAEGTVVSLTAFRDSVLFRSNCSISLVNLYYSVGVQVATGVRRNSSIKALLRSSLLEISD